MLEKWGEEIQIDMCIEEMAELTKALCKYKRAKKLHTDDKEKAKKTLQDVQEEIADVLNTVGQMHYLFGQEKINKIRQEKVNRTMKSNT